MSPSGHSCNASSEDDSLTGHPPLSPPRPFFLASSRPSDDSLENTSDSDRDLSPRSSLAASSTRKTPRNHRRRSQLAISAHSADQPADDQAWTPTTWYDHPGQQRPPPSAYTFPFDPLLSRKSSAESMRVAAPARMPRITDGLPLPQPPFLANTSSNAPYRSSTGSVSNSTLYRSSAAAGIADAAPRTSSATFRTPFLSPASRPSSTWSPPPQFNALPFSAPSNANSTTALPLPPVQKKAMASTRLREKLRDEEKPWLALNKTKLERASKWVTFGCLLVGVAVAALLVFRGYQTVHLLQNSQLCIVLNDDFSGGSLDTNSWSFDVELGGFGNGEFEMTTNSQNNVYISNGQLYIMPTLTSDTISGGYSSVMNNATYTLDGCTASNGVSDQGAFVLPGQKRQYTGNGTTTNGTTGNTTTTGGGTISGGTNSTNSTTPSNSTSSSGGGANACTAVSSTQASTVINPVMSGRINTRGKKSIKYGKVEVRAKLPQGDWLWPAIWMLPEGNDTSTPAGTGVYGGWPASGEIDIMEARGNLPSYPAQGSNYVRSTMNYGPFPSGSTPISTGANSVTATLLKSLYGWVNTKQGNYASDFHVYAMEWTDTWMRFYTDSRLQAMINLDISSKNTDSYFFNVGGFPAVAMNMSSGNYIEVQDPWSTAYGGTAAAPFDQQFYLLINLAVGGTSGWFPDGVGGKPWYDSSATAMHDFAADQSKWSATWPPSANSRAFRIDYVKMWQLC
ncbi:glucan 1,3-beta-glucosidase [Butyriboletus roseoflavus]|nr:glucan 1,3-beta-glucosidase [Butyriboletus roseoflavus]